MKYSSILIILSIFILTSCEKDENEVQPAYDWTIIEYFDNPVEEIYFLDENTGFAASIDHDPIFPPFHFSIYKTTNGGNSWVKTFSREYDYPRDNIRLTDLYFKDINNGYIIIDGNTYKSEDKAETWFKMNIPVQHAKRILFTTPSKGYCFGKKDLAYTTDGGINWIKYTDNLFIDSTDQNENSEFEIVDLQFLSDNSKIGFLTFSNDSTQKVFSTNDGGVNWNIYLKENISVYDMGNIQGVLFISEEEGYLFNSDGVYQILNFGSSIIKIKSFFADYYYFGKYTFCMSNENEIYFTGDELLNKTGDKFNTVSQMTIKLPDDSYKQVGIRDLKIVPDVYGFASGYAHTKANNDKYITTKGIILKYNNK